MCERLDKDPSFHLSLTQMGNDHMTEKDLCAEDKIHVMHTDEFNNDIAVTPDQLAHKLGLSTQTPCLDQAYSVEQDKAHNVHLTGGVDNEVVEEEYVPPVEDVDEDVVMMDTLPSSTLPETVPCPDQVRIWAVEEKLQELWYLKGEGNHVFDVADQELCDNFDGMQETRNDFLCMALRFGFNKQEQIGLPKAFLMSDFMEGLNSTPSLLIQWDFRGVEPYEGLPHGFFSISEV
ncbi:hypothetical protein FA13DRAFT_1801192 [Coprinellus micaceus]|uniref:Uncharacterized protein n=1 Tax=Coprinellus micaceus TaxID=71717 RepID=A0A4Y7SEZ6_COPMI|nr:hypothetical protein FA13DRAFT_1801192 [Coprinellus micaceus]